MYTFKMAQVLAEKNLGTDIENQKEKMMEILRMMRKNWAPQDLLAQVAPAIFVLCGKDILLDNGMAYAKRLIEAGTTVKVKQYKTAEHGFLEVNRPDYTTPDDRKTPEQAAFARDCEQYLIRELRAMLY